MYPFTSFTHTGTCPCQKRTHTYSIRHICGVGITVTDTTDVQEERSGTPSVLLASSPAPVPSCIGNGSTSQHTQPHAAGSSARAVPK